MKYIKNCKNYLCQINDNIDTIINKLNDNKSGALVVLNDDIVSGIITDGDLRRAVSTGLFLASKILNPNFKFIYESEYDNKISYKSDLKIIPVLRKNFKLRGILLNKNNSFNIGKYEVSDDSPALVISEIGNNHNGNVELAKKLVDLSIESGASFVKFQMRDIDSLYLKKSLSLQNSDDLGSEYTFDLLKKFELSTKDLFSVFDYAYKKGITPLCTPWDDNSLINLENYGIEAYKIASADFTNHDFISKIIKTDKPIIISSGMSNKYEITETISLLNNSGCNYVLLHCNSSYPAPFNNVNLKFMNKLSELGATYVGYSGHERGIEVPIAAVALGARVIEKHFTLDKTFEGNDHKVSLLPNEFLKMVNSIRNVEASLIYSNKEKLSQGEYINRQILGKSLVFNKNIKSGNQLNRNDISVTTPGRGLPPYKINDLVGKLLIKDAIAGDFIHENYFNFEVLNNKFSFKRHFGIPVRFHDLNVMLFEFENIDFVEFHLSYSDLTCDISNIDFTKVKFLRVHAPELFENDHIIDLSSDNVEYRSKSIENIRRVIDISIKLIDKIGQDKVDIIINVGGFSKDSFIDKNKKEILYRRVFESLKFLNNNRVNFLIQTMPPFPWHFGGQSFHNLFVELDEIIKYSDMYGFRLCMDISHSKLSSNYYGFNFYKDFLINVSKYVDYMHISDAEGFDNEGLNIGEGDIDIDKLVFTLNNYYKDIPFIPEIWQGHTNFGKGFKLAFGILEEKLL